MSSGMANDISPRAARMERASAGFHGAIWVVTRLYNRPYVYNRQGAFFYFQRKIILLWQILIEGVARQ